MEKTESNKASFWMSVSKGTIISLCVVMVAILLFAFVVKWASLGENVIEPVNQIIKIVAIFFGVLTAIKKNSTKYFYKGMLVGALFSILSFLLFSTLNGAFIFDISIIWDIVFATAIGLISSIIAKILMK